MAVFQRCPVKCSSRLGPKRRPSRLDAPQAVVPRPVAGHWLTKASLLGSAPRPVPASKQTSKQARNRAGPWGRAQSAECRVLTPGCLLGSHERRTEKRATHLLAAYVELESQSQSRALAARLRFRAWRPPDSTLQAISPRIPTSASGWARVLVHFAV